MTEGELEIVRLKLKIEVLQTLIRMLYTLLASSSPSAATALRGSFARLRQEHEKIALRGVPPEYSDLMAGEYQEALDDTLTFIEAGLHG